MVSIFVIEVKVFVFVSQRLGPDVKEGKRRQFNYIGRLIYRICHAVQMSEINDKI